MTKDQSHTNPLLMRTFSTIADWSTWKKRFETVGSAEEAFGLLEWGLRVPMKDPSEAISYYFDLAEMYLRKREDFEAATDSEVAMSGLSRPAQKFTQAALRQRIAQRAWDRLREDYFTVREDGDDGYISLMPIGPYGSKSPVYSTEAGLALFDRLTAFFVTGRNLNNFSLGYTDKVGEGFVRFFADWLFRAAVTDIPEKLTGVERELKVRAQARLPEALALLERLSMLDKVGGYTLCDPERVLGLLETMALDHWGSGRERFPSVDVAFAHGNSCALAYVMLEKKILTRHLKTSS